MWAKKYGNRIDYISHCLHAHKHQKQLDASNKMNATNAIVYVVGTCGKVNGTSPNLMYSFDLPLLFLFGFAFSFLLSRSKAHTN